MQRRAGAGAGFGTCPRAVALVGVLCLALTGCTGTAPLDPDIASRAAPTWRQVALPDGLSPVTLATSGDGLVVGARAAQRPVPHLLLGPDPARLHEVPLSPKSPYAFEATWFSIVARGGHVEGVGGARGGAHANYRWSTWSGTTQAVAEQDQPFGVFGGWGAGDLVGVAFAGDSPVVLGAWQSERTGLDIATWLRTGARWNRQPSTGTALGSTPEELLTAGAIASDGEGLILSGSVTRLGRGSIRVDPSIWRSPGASGPWSRTDLPRPAGTTTTEAHATACSAGRCLVAGASGPRLTLWEVRADSARSLPGIPETTLPDDARVLAPLTLGARDVLLVPRGDRTGLLVRDGQTWTTFDGPAGRPVSAVVQAGSIVLVTADASGAHRLWTARP